MSPKGSLDVDIPLFHGGYLVADMLRATILTQADYQVEQSQRDFRFSQGNKPVNEVPIRVGLGLTTESEVPADWERHHYIMHLNIPLDYEWFVS
jgi:hypothetical protein